eukprot:CAMPEP_0184649674 /NCGR_PEP_ID=MMETSP0308-20130426/7072_1 /TAXON_ID=38269 /ORGANISM="Gloeochaete witrockiana, Strain SAG 46.84" /LENGTH=152 /DNA_ID=CAMNT_0027082579 /DNA_START=1103 /DNA_END=1560 /DNA_ORIENTATION=-
MEQLGIGKVEQSLVESLSEWLKCLGSLKELSVGFVDFLETLDVQQQSQLNRLRLLNLYLDNNNSQRFSVGSLAAIATLPSMSKLSLSLAYKDGGGDSFCIQEFVSGGFYLMQNLKELDLYLGGLDLVLPKDSASATDEDAAGADACICIAKL